MRSQSLRRRRSQRVRSTSLGRDGDRRCGCASTDLRQSPHLKGPGPFSFQSMPRTVLVVDDSAAFRATARMLLTARGYQVVGVAGDVASALEAARALRPDCVVCDVNLPDGDGVTLAGQLTRG